MAIKPFTLSIPASEVNDLKLRLKAARLPQPIEGADWERGVPPTYLKKLAKHWEETFDWRKAEAKLNEFPQFTTEIDGQTIHFFHIKSEDANATPLLLIHGWPSSSVEYLKTFELLTKPKDGKAFHVIAPTIPGFGLSTPVTQTGWQSPRTAAAFKTLMQELGYERYGVHGSDVGADVLGELVKIDSERIAGTHMATDTSTIVYSVAAFMGGGDPAQNPALSDAEKAQVKAIQENDWKEGEGYLKIQSTRPSTLAFGLNDSPVGQLAWQVEKYKLWTNPSDELPEKKIDIDQMLTNVSLYWFTGAGAASANFIYENYHAQRAWGAAPQVPQGFALFNAQSCARVLMDPEHKIAHWSEFKEGQHFPAMEVPELFAGDIQKFFSSLQ